MKIFALFLVLSFISGISVFSQDEKEIFTIEKEIKHLPVINQGSTGTCWSFATTSFLESEIIRKGFQEVDLSEMFFVNYAYKNKAKEFLQNNGKNKIGQGGQAHDVLDVLREKGLSTYKAFPGVKKEGKYRHNNLVKELKKEVAILKKKGKDFDPDLIKELTPILEEQVGKIPRKVKTQFRKLKPIKISKKLKINADEYVELSSYNHHPFYKPFVLNVPDNWSHALYYNLPIDEFMEVIFYSLNKGYTVAWDGDISEKTFQNKKGKADLPEDQINKVNQELRQKTFQNHSTTDDHLMHLVGLSKDSEGRDCFYTKNSWGADSNDYGGYLHMTEDYVRLKTIAILVHKDAIPENIRTKLNL